MEIETIKDAGKVALVDMLNRGLQVEYGLILNYPRIIDKLIMVDKINDAQLNKDLEQIGKDSFRHSGALGKLIGQLGGEALWRVDIIERLVDVETMLAQQLDKEKTALLLYQQAEHVAAQNKTKVHVKDFWGRLIRMEDEIPIDVVNLDDIIRTLDRIIIDETKHVKLVENSIATLKMLMNK